MATEVRRMLDNQDHNKKNEYFGIVGAIVALIVLWVVVLSLGLLTFETHTDTEHAAVESSEAVTATTDHTTHEVGEHTTSETTNATTHAAHSSGGHVATAPPVWTVIPFAVLLLCIALLPLFSKTEHWWEHNINRLKVAAGLGLITLAYYACFHTGTVDVHWPVHDIAESTESGIQWHLAATVLLNALMSEFIPFIILLFALYTIAGGVRIEGDLQANPMTNASFMLAGGLLASFIGTTGAAMLLIRPLLETNKERKFLAHTVVWFIFIVCNCGGCLLPIGDPPLFLGYLAGVPFTWTLSLWEPWLFVNGLLILSYLLYDEFFCYRKESIRDMKRDLTETTRLKITGLKLNAPLLLGVVFAVALLDPSKPLPLTNWHAPMYLREIVQLALVAISLYAGCSIIRKKNDFNFHAIIEVAALFSGIFICMQPALAILGVYGGDLGINSPMKFFWVTGGLSAVLDNAPTYMVFFKTAQAMGPGESTEVVHIASGNIQTVILQAISMAAVFMGAMTYIGNGPNFMVKAIAEKAGVKMPSFFGYIGYSVCILGPIMGLTAWRYF